MSLNIDKSTWARVRFGDVVRNVNESLRDQGSAIDRVIAMEHLDPGELTITRCGAIDEGTTFTRRVRPGQTLFGKRRAYQRKVARADFDAICSGDILTFESDPDRLLPDLLPFIAQSDPFFDHALGTSAGSLSPRTNWKDLANFEFDLPSLHDQRRIADLLWAAEHQMDAQRRLLSSMAVAKRRAMDDLAAKIAGTEVRLGEVLDIVRGGSPRPINDYFTDDPDGLSWIKIGDVPPDGKYIERTAQKIRPEGQSKTRTVSPGDFLLSNSMSFGRPYIVRIDGCIHDGWLSLSDTDGVWRTDYLYYLLRSTVVQAQFSRAAGGSTVKNLNTDIVRDVVVTLPSLEAQDDTLGRMSEFEHSTERVTEALRAVHGLRSILLNNVIGGQE